MTVPGKIIEVEPTTEHQGTVYNQRVVVELSDGIQIGLFDLDARIDDQMVGCEVNLQIGTLTETGAFELLEEPERRIVPSEDEPHHWREHRYTGEVVDISNRLEHTFEVELDVGVGTVVVNPDKARFPELDIGDFLRVDTLRSDIHGVDDF